MKNISKTDKKILNEFEINYLVLLLNASISKLNSNSEIVSDEYSNLIEVLKAFDYVDKNLEKQEKNIDKNYIKKHPVKNIKELSKHNLILPKPTSARNKIFIEYCKENNLELIAKHEISSSALVKEMVLNDIGIGFAETDSLSDIMNDIEIVEKVQIESMQEGIATLKKNMVNKATSELVKEIKTYYNISATNNKHK